LGGRRRREGFGTKRYSELGPFSFILFFVWAFFRWLVLFSPLFATKTSGAIGPHVLDRGCKISIPEMFISTEKIESKKCNDDQLRRKMEMQIFLLKTVV
jgi:hypothetical protein